MAPSDRAEGLGLFSPGQRPGFGVSPQDRMRPEGPRYRAGMRRLCDPRGTGIDLRSVVAPRWGAAGIAQPSKPRAMPWAKQSRAFSPVRRAGGEKGGTWNPAGRA
jgi:hypothetical protein